MRRLRAGGQPVQHFQSFAFALGLDAMPEHELRPGRMHSRLELEAAAFFWLFDGPSRKNLGNLGYIALRVTAAYAQRVQFQQFTSIIFVEATRAFALIGTRIGTRRPLRIAAPVPSVRTRRKTQGPRRVWSDTHPIVQVVQHGRTFRRGHKQIFELAEGMRTDDIAFVAGQHQAVESFVHENIEVVDPEVGHHFVQLALAIDGA